MGVPTLVPLPDYSKTTLLIVTVIKLFRAHEKE